MNPSPPLAAAPRERLTSDGTEGVAMAGPQEDQEPELHESEEEGRTGEEQAAINRENDPPA